jgi:hypothetical protein
VSVPSIKRREMPKFTTRIEIRNEAIRVRNEIMQLFNDQDYWNEFVRKPDEKEINCDPDGVLDKLAESMAKIITQTDNRDGGRDG